MKNRLMILALAVTVLATVLLGCAKQEENPTTEPDTTVSETTTQEETTAKSPGEALSEGALRPVPRCVKAPPISARPPLVPGRPYPAPWNKTKKKGLVHQNKSFFYTGRRHHINGSLGVIIRKIRFRQYPGCCGFGGSPSARPGNSIPGAAAQFSSFRSPCPCKYASSCRLAS